MSVDKGESDEGLHHDRNSSQAGSWGPMVHSYILDSHLSGLVSAWWMRSHWGGGLHFPLQGRQLQQPPPEDRLVGGSPHPWSPPGTLSNSLSPQLPKAGQNPVFTRRLGGAAHRRGRKLNSRGVNPGSVTCQPRGAGEVLYPALCLSASLVK